MLAIISHVACSAPDPGPLHPERPERLDAIQNRLLSSGLDAVCLHHEAPEVTREQLMRAHDGAYIDTIFQRGELNEQVWLDDDTSMTPESLPAALRAAGAAILGVDLVLSGQASAAFCPVRPPGHHAERSRAMGSCLFNNVAVGASHALHSHGLSRVAIVDFDVHHGNGTEDIFRNDDRILFCSTFQHPWYPFTGHDSDTRNLVDVPLKAGAGSHQFRQGVSEHWLPALERYAPELIMVSAGFDAHQCDDMSTLKLVDDDFVWVTREIMRIASRHANGRVVSVLEGGYEIEVLGNSALGHIRELMR